MKRNLLTLFGLLTVGFASLAFTACGGGDDDDDVPAVVEEPAVVPTTVEQAKEMLMGQWQFPGVGFDFYADEKYEEFNSDGHYYNFWKIKEDAPDGEWYSDFKGEYVGYLLYNGFEFEPFEKEPTTGLIFHYNDYSSRHVVGYSGLTKYKLTYNPDVDVYSVSTRPSKPIEYTEVPRTAERAKEMAVGTWQYVEINDAYKDYAEELYYVLNTDGSTYMIFKIKTDAPDGKWYSAYKGKYVRYRVWMKYEFFPDAKKPSKGSYRLTGGPKDPSDTSLFFYSNLTSKTLTLLFDDFIRTDKTFTYTEVPYPY